MNTFHGDNRISHQPSDIFEFALQKWLVCHPSIDIFMEIDEQPLEVRANLLEINPKWRDTSTVGWMCWQLLFQVAPEYIRSCNPRGRNQERVLAFHNTQILFRSKFSPAEKTRELYDWPTFPQVARRNNPTYSIYATDRSLKKLFNWQSADSFNLSPTELHVTGSDWSPACNSFWMRLPVRSRLDWHLWAQVCLRR